MANGHVAFDAAFRLLGEYYFIFASAGGRSAHTRATVLSRCHFAAQMPPAYFRGLIALDTGF